MSDSPLHGVVVPAMTPIDEDENVDEAAFRRVIRGLVGAGVHGLFVGGSAGEGPLLATDQWRRMAETALDEVGDALPVLCGGNQIRPGGHRDGLWPPVSPLEPCDSRRRAGNDALVRDDAFGV